MDILLQSKFELFTAQVSSQSGGKWAGIGHNHKLNRFWALSAKIQHRICLFSLVHSTDWAHHLGCDLISWGYISFSCYWSFSQTTAPPWNNTTLSLWSFKEPDACARQKHFFRHWEDHTKSQRRFKYTLNNVREDKSCELLTACAADIRSSLGFKFEPKSVFFAINMNPWKAKGGCWQQESSKCKL